MVRNKVVFLREQRSKKSNDLGFEHNLLKASLRPILTSVALVALTTVGLLSFRRFYPLDQVAIVYLMPVLVAATRGGLIPSIIAALLGAAAINFFFYPPIYTFWIDDPQHIIELMLFIFVALAACNLAERLRHEARISRRQEIEIRNLYKFSRQLAVCTTPMDINLAVQTFFARYLNRRTVLFGRDARGDGSSQAIEDQTIPEKIRHKAIALMTTRSSVTQTVTDETTNSVWLIKAIPPQIYDFSVIAIELGSGDIGSLEFVRRHVDVLLAEALAALVRIDIARAVTLARVHFKAEVFRQALVGSVSHELRSPLASIIGSASVLDIEPSIQRNKRISSLVHAIHDEAKRLDTDLARLLEITRLSDETICPHMEWHDPVDIINEAIARKKQRLAGHRLRIDVPSDLPLVKVDLALLVQALGELLENAAKYSPECSTIMISAYIENKYFVLRVHDAGIGMTQDEMLHSGKRSFRGNRSNHPSGAGLGLWIANAFVAAIGGTITAESEGPDLGTTISVNLPLPYKAIIEDVGAIDG
jgi:two-component system sensor histidine kinase KdpD